MTSRDPSPHTGAPAPRPPARDATAALRAGRVAAAVQASLALAAVLLVGGAVVFAVEVHVQDQQITAQLVSVVSTVNDASDPPPGMVVALRDSAGNVLVGAYASTTTTMLTGPTGFSDVHLDGRHYRALVADNSHARAVALLDLQPLRHRPQSCVAVTGGRRASRYPGLGHGGHLAHAPIDPPLAHALALQRRFVADASHELRAPLTVLHTRAQLLARRFDNGQTPAAREQIDALIADTRALGDVIEDLLASASMTTDTAPRDRVEVSAVADAVGTSMSEHAQSTGVNLLVERDTGSPAADFVVLGSAPALRRAITALVDNALAAEHVGGTITIRVGRRGGAVNVEVADDGTGVDPAAMGALFTRVSHGDSPTTTSGVRHYGIGLTLVRETMHTHHGDIQVGQTPGGGTTVTLTTPAAPAPHDRRPHGLGRSRVPGPGTDRQP